MLNEDEKQVVITILTKYLMEQEATYKEFKTIEKIIKKLTSEE